MKVKFKKLGSFSKVPTKAHLNDAGFDFYSSSFGTDFNGYIEYETGIALEIPKNHVGLMFPRSSISNFNLSLSNSVGIIDENYRGTIKFRFYKLSNEKLPYELGDRIGQLLIIPYPQIELEEVSELSNSERGTGGFGSSGK